MNIAERFWAKVDRDGPVFNGASCWVWTAHRGPAGYGTFGITSRHRVLAHRFAYEKMVGPIPEGLQLDHLCRNRACVNPAHLEPVTCRTNLLRGDTFQAANAAKTHCLRGHPLSGNNLSIVLKRRICRTCKRETMRQLKEKRANG